MNFEQVIQHLFSKRPQVNPNKVELTRTVAEKIGSPHLAYPTLHIAGTNGKGSVSLKIAKALELTGRKVGLFTSPHIDSFCERIVINGVQIPQERVKKGLLELFDLGKELCFFELGTLLAFDYFREEKVDIAVFEAGLGGLLDATNIVQPLVSIITSVALDHEDILGKTLEEIAEQKAGIIKPGIPLVIGPKADYPIMQKADRLYKVDPVPGFYDLENTAIARKALEVLGMAYEEEGLKARPPCRFEKIKGRFMLDVAHNPDGIERLLEALPNKPFSAVVGMAQDKNLRTCLTLLATRADHLYLVPTTSPKKAQPVEMAQILQEAGFKNFTITSIREALALQKRYLICGSFYIMKEAREEILGVHIAQDEPFLSW